RKFGKSSAYHIVAARRIEDLQPIARRQGWNRVIQPADYQPWTDDYSNLLSLIRWHSSAPLPLGEAAARSAAGEGHKSFRILRPSPLPLPEREGCSHQLLCCACACAIWS